MLATHTGNGDVAIHLYPLDYTPLRETLSKDVRQTLEMKLSVLFLN